MQHQYYVYEGMEVMKTGREATRNITVKTYQGSKRVPETVVEICPVPAAGVAQWKRWVKMNELFIISEAGDEYDDIVGLENDKNTEPVYDEVDNILDSLRKKNDHKNDPNA